jgi:hypothetical protein
MTLNLDNGRVTFGDHDEIELATATDPVCGCELRRADAAGAVDRHGAFLAEPERYARPDEAALAGP